MMQKSSWFMRKREARALGGSVESLCVEKIADNVAMIRIKKDSGHSFTDIKKWAQEREFPLSTTFLKGGLGPRGTSNAFSHFYFGNRTVYIDADHPAAVEFALTFG